MSLLNVFNNFASSPTRQLALFGTANAICMHGLKCYTDAKNGKTSSSSEIAKTVVFPALAALSANLAIPSVLSRKPRNTFAGYLDISLLVFTVATPAIHAVYVAKKIWNINF